MFEKSKNIIFLSREKIKVFKVILGNKGERKLLLDSIWNKDNLFEIFDKIKKDFGKEYRVLIDESLSYIVELNFKEETQVNREAVKKSAEEQVPENLSETLWDFVEIGTTSKKETKVQLFALTKFASDCLVYATNKSGLKIQAIEPIAFSVNRLLVEQKITSPFIVYYSDLSNLLFSSAEGLILNSKIIGESGLEKEILLMKNSLKKIFSLEIETIFVSSQNSELKADELGLKIQQINLDPVVGIANKENISGKDEEVLNVWIPKIEISNNTQVDKINEKENTVLDDDTKQDFSGKKENVEEIEDFDKKSSSIGKKILFFLLGLLIAGIIGGGIFVYQKSIKSSKQVVEISGTPTPTIVISPQASPSPELKLSDIKIKVLNGSGKAGEAGKLTEVLKKANFVVAKTGNADKYDYEQTIIEVKKEVSKEALSVLDKTLKDLYDFKYSSGEISDKLYDIVIIIGKK